MLSWCLCKHSSSDPLSAQMTYQNVKFNRTLSQLNKTDGLHAGSCSAQWVRGEELVGLFPVGFVECSFGVKQSVSKVWAGD